MKFFLSTLLTLCLIGLANGQAPLKNIIMPSPNVASLGKYGEVPVSLYTGVPNISVPIYEIKNGPLSLPISLSYHAGGIRVEEMASSVGLGWSLNAGGIIGRNVMSRPDDLNGWSSRPLAQRVETIMNSANTAQIINFATAVENGQDDGAADIYYYNFNQYAGKFFYDQEGNTHTLPYKKLKIDNGSAGWKIVVEDGTEYTFEKFETVEVFECTDAPKTTTAWYLTKIKSSDGNREINLSYEEEASYIVTTLPAQTKYLDIVGNQHVCLQSSLGCPRESKYITYRLTKIDFDERLCQIQL